MIKNPIMKCTTFGFLTGFGGVIILPIAIPTNIGNVLYVQIQLLFMKGFKINGYQEVSIRIWNNLRRISSKCYEYENNDNEVEEFQLLITNKAMLLSHI